MKKTLPNRRGPPKALTTEQIEKLRESRQKGTSYEQLGWDFEINPKTAMKVVKYQGAYKRNL